MVAYNLLLSIFPLALISLFVAGRVLRSPGARRLGASTTRSGSSPRRPRATLIDGRPPARAVLDHGRASSRWSPRCGSARPSGARWTRRSAASTSCPAASWVRQKLFGFGMLVVVLRVHRRERRSCRRCSRCWSTAPSDLPFGLDSVSGLVYWRHVRRRPAGPVRRALHHLLARCPRARSPGRCVWPGALGRHAGDGRRRLRRSRSTSPTPRRCGSARRAVFVLIALVWFYVLAMILLAGAVVNELRLTGSADARERAVRRHGALPQPPRRRALGRPGGQRG